MRHPDTLPREPNDVRGVAAVLVVIAVLGGCADSQPARTASPAATTAVSDAPVATLATEIPSTPSPVGTEVAVPAVFEVTSHKSGDIVSTSTVTISGVASPGAEIVQDISFAPDERTTAGPDGTWAIVVTLDQGPNTLRFRVGDEKSTTKELTLTYAVSAAVLATPAAATPPPATPPAATPAPATPRAATPTPATPVAAFGLAHGNLGRSDLLEVFFATEGFTFEDSPLTDGTQRRLGMSDVALVELYGTPAVREVTISAPLLLSGPDASTYAANLGRYVGGVIGFADGSKSAAITKWLQGLMEASGGLEDVDKTKTFGKLKVHFRWDATVLGFAFLDFTVSK